MAHGLKTGDENDVMLELSIGGIFGESKSNQKDDRIEDLNVNVNVNVNVESKRQIQAQLRRELRRKREEKLKKPVDFGSCGSVTGSFVEDNEWLQKQIVQQNDDVLEVEHARKKERVRNSPENISSVSTAPVTNGFVSRKVVPVAGDSQVVAPAACRSFRLYNMNLKPKEGGGSSTYSDGQCSSHQGAVTNDDSGSNSSNSQLDQQMTSTSAIRANPCDKPTGSVKQTVTVTEPGQVDTHGSSVSNPVETKQGSVLARMPRVSTTGNGPNGKMVSGFLYRYTKTEVSIVCLCHGESFSPAGFVEHAGGVDIVHPLKHITIFPTAFAS